MPWKRKPSLPRRRLYDRGLRVLLYLCGFITCALLVLIIGYIFYRGIPNITWELLDHPDQLHQRHHRHPAQHPQHPLPGAAGHGHRAAPGRGRRHLSDGIRHQPQAGGRH